MILLELLDLVLIQRNANGTYKRKGKKFINGTTSDNILYGSFAVIMGSEYTLTL